VTNGVSASYAIFHSSLHACVVVFGICNIGPLPNEGGITTARGED
jgi:anaerobic C4-dicarboxylate transporter